MKATDAKSYAEAFDTIDRRRVAGQMTDGEVTVGRLRLTAEIHELIRPLWQKLIIFLFWASLILGVAVMILRGATAASGLSG